MPLLIGTLVILVLSLGIHEAAHGWVAYKCGDSTAKDLGRVTLDPFVHIDLFMSIILPVFLFLTSGFIFGGAKPVPVNFHRLRRGHFDMALVAIAGPLSNFLIAIVLFLILRLVVLDFEILTADKIGARIIADGVKWNLILAAFNLLPIPPLDGSRVMAWLLPENLRNPYIRIEPIGILLVIGFVFLLGGQVIVMKMAHDLGTWVEFIVTLGGTW